MNSYWESKLQETEQKHLIPQVDTLLHQLEAIDWDCLQYQRELLEKEQETEKEYSPFSSYQNASDIQEKAEVDQLLSEGRVGVLVVAGGQGSRLGFDGPKGCFPIMETGETLFQLLAERIKSESEQAGRPLPLAIMTSPANHHETVQHFEEHSYFGLKPSQVEFFQQSILPLLDEQGKLFLDAPDQLAVGADGNGGALFHFYQSGIGRKWKENGVRLVNFILVDNPLADPFDRALLAHHYASDNEITIKCISREDPEEKVGVLVSTDKGASVVEYSELPEGVRYGKKSDGSLLYPCANISLFCFSLDFIERSTRWELPLHLAHKAVARLNEEGKPEKPDSPNAWKFERFIFDLLPHAEKVTALLYPREECFAPLKNKEGAYGPEGVRAALAVSRG